jgi:RNA methyltransferase, TrmH family
LRRPTQNPRMTRPHSPAARDQTPFEHVSSFSNETVKLLRSLERKKARSETGLFLAEGARLAEEGLRQGWRPVVVLSSPAALERPNTVALLHRLQAAGARVLTVSEKVLSAVSQKDNPQAVVSAFQQRTRRLEDLPTQGARRWVALYEVRDPGNLGTIIRTSDACGVDGVILVGTCCDLFSGETVRATMGSLFATPVAHAGFDEFNAWRRSCSASLIAASMHGRARPDAIAYGERTIVLMGNEQSGLPPEVEAACDALVRIPMMGAADSLNLASAASIMIYEAWRGRGFEGAA